MIETFKAPQAPSKKEDYISRDAAIHEFKTIGNIFVYGRELCEAIISTIDSIPAADVRPVVRGRWVGNKRHQSCSECHMTYCVPDGLDGELDMTAYHFCPNCGAMMEES